MSTVTDFFRGKREKAKDIGTHDKFIITQRGEEELHKNLPGARNNILLVLETRGSSTMDEIARHPACRYPRGKVERLLVKMMEKDKTVRAANISASDAADAGDIEEGA
jgi:hypothetical protein